MASGTAALSTTKATHTARTVETAPDDQQDTSSNESSLHTSDRFERTTSPVLRKAGGAAFPAPTDSALAEDLQSQIRQNIEAERFRPPVRSQRASTTSTKSTAASFQPADNMWVNQDPDTVPSSVLDGVDALKADGADVELLGASSDWPEGHYELTVDGQQNAYLYDAENGTFTQQSNVAEGQDPTTLQVPQDTAEPASTFQPADNQWVDQDPSSVPSSVLEAVDALQADGADVELLGASSDWPEGHYELTVDGQQNAYLYDAENGTFTQQSNVAEGQDPTTLQVPQDTAEPASTFQPADNQWVDQDPDTVPSSVLEAVDALQADGANVELLGASSNWPVGHYELTVDGQQNAYLYDEQMGTLTQQSNVPVGQDPIVLDTTPGVIEVAAGGNISDALANAEPGEVVQLEAGSYSVEETLFMPPGVTLSGVGSETIIENRATGAAIRVEPGVEGSTIRDLTVEGHGGDASGIFVRGDNTTISNVVSSGNEGHGLSLHEAQHCVIENCTVQNNGRIGISMYDADYNTISGCTSNNNANEGITIDHDSDYNTVTGNVLDGNCTRGGVGGIGIDWAEGNIVSGNTITGTQNAYAGITFQNNEGMSQNNELLNNTIEHDGGPGIWLGYQLYPSQSPDWNGTDNTGPSPTNSTLVSGNDITTTNFDDIIIVDGHSHEAVAQDGWNAIVVLADGSTEQRGEGTLNEGNVLVDNG